MIENQLYGLEKCDIEKILHVLQKNIKVEAIVLFGSRAKGTFHAGSNIDIALEGLNLVLDDILDAYTELDNLNLPYKFDIILYNRIKEQALIDHINRVGIVLFSKL